MYHYAANNPVRYVDPDGRSDIYKEWNRLNSKEKEIILWDVRFVFIPSFRKNAATATKSAIENYNINGWGDRSDAFRHAMWSALNAQTGGEDFARTWGDAHESQPDTSEKADLYMDIHNNEIGYEIGKNNPNASLEQLSKLIKEKIDNGELLILDRETQQLYKSNDLDYENPLSFDDEFIMRKDFSKKLLDEVSK